MRNTLLLRKDSIVGDSWRWLRLDNSGEPQGAIHAGSLADAAGEAAGLRVVILAPGKDCLLTQVDIPGRSRQKLLRAVPFALEEQLSDEVENLHFAVAAAMVEGAWPVAVVSKAYMETLQLAVTEAGLDVQQVVPEMLAIPYAGNETSVLVENDVALVRTGSVAGYAVDSDNLGMLLALQKVDEDEQLPALHLYVRQDNLQPDTAEFMGETRVESYSGDPLTVFAEGVDAQAVNLLQGDYSRAGDWARVLRPWRATAALLLAVVLVSNVVMGVDYFRLSRERDQLTTQIEETFKKAVPGTRRIVNPRVQMQQQLDSLQRRAGAGGGFLSLLGQSGAVLKDMQGVEINGVSFRAGRLDIDLAVASLQLLDQLKQALIQPGKLAVEIQTATTGKDQRVQSRLRIEASGT
ncbi:MAG: type II secretion system protein GspL [Gammaproteobacteria bacterium]|jgi:general secretion pathway protein L|nr:type II secretion system protein GspL [Gammaproteobacteria bacterium]